MKRLTAILLALALLCALLPAALLPAGAEIILPPDPFDDDVISGTCGEHLKWKLNKNSGALTISGTGAMDDWDFLQAPWNFGGENYDKILTAVLLDGVTSIGNHAFASCEKLTSVTIPGSVQTIGESAFSFCIGLTSVILPNGVQLIGDGAFSDCKGLASVSIPTSVTRIDANAFCGCTSLNSIAIPESVTSIGYWAFGGSGIYNNEANWADGVLYIGNCLIKAKDTLTGAYTIRQGTRLLADEAFRSCKDMTAVTIPTGITNIPDWTFSGCTGLKDVYYLGTEAEWKTVTIGEYNECLTGAELHCKPTHTHNYAAVVTPPTCTEQGFTTYSCVCGDTYVDDYVAALGHDYAAVVTAPTCTEKGYTTNTCTRCGDTYTDAETDALGHDYAAVVTAPTCLEKGYTTHTCTRCGDSYTDTETDALGHSWDEGEITTPATETTDGVKTYTCTVCGATKTEAVPATGEEACQHEHGHPDRKDATCTEPGYDRVICDDCGAVISEEILPALGHNLVTDEAVAPTCTQNGLTEGKHCTRCDYKIAQEVVPMLPHSYKNGVCTVCGAKDPDYRPFEPVKFNDVKETDWFFDAVNYAVEMGLMNGVGSNNFAPNAPMTRAMLVTVLWRYEGSLEEGENTFTDVPAGQWYTKAVAWAAANGIVGGVGNNKFDPNGNITREQMAAILYRYAQKKGFDTSAYGDLSGFPDRGKISAWAADAFVWTVGAGIIGGADGHLLPQGNATRAQVSTILMRFIEKFAK